MEASQSSHDRKLRLVLFPLLGYLVGVASLLIQFFLWWGRQPALELGVSAIGFSSTSRIRSVPQQLAQIEAMHGAITGFRIGRLREAALTIEWSDPEQVEQFANVLQREIKFYDARIESPLEGAIVCYDNGVVIWRDCELIAARGAKVLPCSKWLKLDFRGKSGSGGNRDAVSARDGRYGNCDYFRIDTEPTAHVYFPSAYVETVRRNPSLVDEPPDIKQRILEAARQIYNPNTADRTLQERGEIARELRKIRQTLVDFRARINDQVIVTLAVQNKSRAPNYLLKDGLVRICREEDECKDLELQMRSAERLEGATVAWVVLESKPLSPSALEFIHQAIKREYPAVAVVRDVHENIWHTEATPATIIYTERTKEELSANAREALLDEVF